MKLLLDAGNTRVKLSWVAQQADARATETVAFGYEQMAALTQWVAALPGWPGRVWGVSVVDEARMARLEAAVAAAAPVAHALPVRWLQARRHAAGVRNDYAAASGLGPDRWAALLGLAWYERRLGADARAPVLLASFGTATTLDALLPLFDDETCDYVFPGGLILPGVALMAHALAQGTARLPETPGQVHSFPTQTRDAIATGVVAAQVGAVWRQWRQLGLHSGRPARRLYVTGGAWPQVETELKQWFDADQIIWLAAPVLDGLACLASCKFDVDH